MSLSNNIPDNKSFIDNVKIYFHKLIHEYKYKEIEYINNKFNVSLIYINSENNRKIEIKNEYNYTDYGYSVSIYNLENEEYNILVNIPYNQEDKECLFIKYSTLFILNNNDLLDIIIGNNWITYKKILYWIKEEK